MQTDGTSRATPTRGGRHLADQLSIHRLAVFHTLVDEGTMSKASGRLFMTQPAISAHIKALERGLGVSLFDRVGRRSVVNVAGRVLYRKAEQLFSAADDLRAAMEELKGAHLGRLSLGASVVWQYHLAGSLQRFKTGFPYAELSPQVANSDRVEKLVVERSVDIGFIARASERRGLASEYLGQDELVPVCAPTHPLDGRNNGDRTDLGDEPLVVQEVGSAARAATDALLTTLDTQPKIWMELGSQEAIKQVVREGQGLGMVSRAGSSYELDAGLLAIVGIPQLRASLHLHAIYLKQRSLTHLQKAFLEIVSSDVALVRSRRTAGRSWIGPDSPEDSLLVGKTA